MLRCNTDDIQYCIIIYYFILDLTFLLMSECTSSLATGRLANANVEAVKYETFELQRNRQLSLINSAHLRTLSRTKIWSTSPFKIQIHSRIHTNTPEHTHKHTDTYINSSTRSERGCALLTQVIAVIHKPNRSRSRATDWLADWCSMASLREHTGAELVK